MKFIKHLVLLLLIVNSASAQTHSYQKAESNSAEVGSNISDYTQVPENVQEFSMKLPYPIIFIHGLASSSSTWDAFTNYLDSQFGFTYGRRLDFCLNYDGDNTSANTLIYPTNGADIKLFLVSPLNIGDYYYVNFDVSQNGSIPTNVLSNQSAIVKQGAALSEAIKRVLQVSGKDKVILMGHSMGGLAAREYLQNPSIWQSDGRHHIAKLVTTGTPHGGSNSSSFGVPITGIDEQSEAVRDLRRTYFYSGNNGVYLFSGIEDLSYMEDQLCCYFYNSDVNCNGVGGTGESIVGLNSKNLIGDIDYSCIIGDCSGCLIDLNYNTDGVVNTYSANLNNFYTGLRQNLGACVFTHTSSSLSQIHTTLPSLTYENLQGLDEPELFDLSYGVELNSNYIGFITEQSINNLMAPIDYDDYTFSINRNKTIGVNFSNIPSVPSFTVALYNSSYNLIGQIHGNNGSANLSFTESLSSGTYYLEVTGDPDATSFLNPYSFSINDITGVDEISALRLKIFPNPTNGIITIDCGEDSSFKNDYTIEVENLYGQSIYSEKVTQQKTRIDIGSSASSGFYFVYLKDENGNRGAVQRVVVQ